jgi:hypothetical protein
MLRFIEIFQKLIGKEPIISLRLIPTVLYVVDVMKVEELQWLSKTSLNL